MRPFFSCTRRAAVRAVCALLLFAAALRLLSLAAPGRTAARSDTALTLAVLSADTAGRWSRLVLAQSPLLRAAPDPVQSPDPGVSLPPDGEDDAPLPSASPGAKIVAQTLAPSKNAVYLSADGVYIANRSAQSVDPAALLAREVSFALPADGPQILIYHSHACEAYAPSCAEDTYVPSDASRTLDPDYNMVRVGEEMKTVFESLGFSVLHDTTLYDYPEYSSAYTRSREAVSKTLAEHPTIRIALDVHRDALTGSDGTIYKALTTVDGTPAAQVMLVMGTNDRGSHPNWPENLALAVKVQKGLNSLYPTLARPMTLRASHYNQQLTPGAMLVEVGTHGNTLDEALTGARLFARAAAQVFRTLEE